MARSKKYPTKHAAARARAEKRKVVASNGAFRLQDYITLNLAFWALCIIQLLLVKFMMRDMSGLYFFFGFIMVAFTVASVVDYFFTRNDIGRSDGGHA